MFSSAAAVHIVGSTHACQCIDTVFAPPGAAPGSSEADGAGSDAGHLFVVGTQGGCSGPRARDEVHLVEYVEESNSVRTLAVFPHGSDAQDDGDGSEEGGEGEAKAKEATREVWHLAAHPTRGSWLFSCGSDDAGRVGALYEMDVGASPPRLRELARLPTAATGMLRRALWHPADDDVGAGADLNSSSSTTERFATVHDDCLRLWDVSEDGSALEEIGDCPLVADESHHAACWDPHHLDEVSVSSGRGILGVDLRSMEIVRRIDDAHRLSVRSIDYNPNKPYYLVSGGDDRRVKFWDVRRPEAPVKVVTAHSHWVCNAKYNRFHDQLVLTSGTDAVVNLWRLSSISSAPLLDVDDYLDDEDDDEEGAGAREGAAATSAASTTDTADGLVKSFEDHSESIFGAAWSASDAWVFASLSYDRKLVINHVPSAEKYKILL